MKIHEYQAARLFQKYNIPTGGGEVATEVPEALAIADKVGYPVVLKSQVLVGGRGKAGGVKVVKNKEELQKIFPEIRKLNIKGYPVEKILIVHAINIKKEYYAAITIDNTKDDVVIIASAAGGVDIEDTAKTNPDAIKKFYLNGSREIDASRWPAFITAVFSDPNQQKIATDIFQKLVKLFFEGDCSLAEINPLVVDDKGQIIAADAKINFDDNALYRHPDYVEMRDLKYEDADELEAKQKDLSFVKLDGNVGCIVNGAGLAMATMDIVNLSGGKPANFLDVGGSSNPEKVLNALKIILRNPHVKGVLINIFGGITRCDDIAKGILAARVELKMKVPIVVRLTGTNEKEAKAMLAAEGINTFATMREGVNEIVKATK